MPSLCQRIWFSLIATQSNPRSVYHRHRPCQESVATPLQLFALLLFAPPLVFTLQKLFELVAFVERSHQLAVTGHNLKKSFRVLSVSFDIGGHDGFDQNRFLVEIFSPCFKHLRSIFLASEEIVSFKQECQRHGKQTAHRENC